jgi:hypothetical protein
MQIVSIRSSVRRSAASISDGLPRSKTELVDQCRTKLDKLDSGTGCIRFRRTEEPQVIAAREGTGK